MCSRLTLNIFSQKYIISKYKLNKQVGSVIFQEDSSLKNMNMNIALHNIHMIITCYIHIQINDNKPKQPFVHFSK